MSLVCEGCKKAYKLKHAYEKHVAVCDKIAAKPSVEGAENTAPSSSTTTAPTPVEITAPAAIPAGATNDQKVAALNSLFTRFENLLYGEGTVGEKAREDIISLMIIRLLEPHFTTGTIDVMDLEKNCYSVAITSDNVKYVLMKNLSTLQACDIMGELGRIWRLVLSVHLITREIFKSDRYLSVKSDAILAAMVRDLAGFDFENFPSDCLADVYQHFIHRQFRGEKSSRLGQHFTPPHIVDMIVHGVNIPPSAVVCDPFCGTGGFLLSAYKHGGIDAKSINGTEIDIDVFRYAIANMLISTGSVCTGMRNASAFVKTTTKYDVILTNPPFGGSVQKDSVDVSWFAGIKTRSRNLLCLQLCMHLLKPNGVCSLVFPNGGEMNKCKGAEFEVRKRLCTEFNNLSITYLPQGTFEYTGIGTAIISFTKRDGKTIDGTSGIEFYELRDGTRVHLRTVIGAEVSNTDYSFSEKDYRPVEAAPVSAGFEIKKLDEIAEIKYGTRIVKDSATTGEYPVYGGGDITFYTNEFNRDGETVIVSRFGVSKNCVRVIKGKFYLNDSGMSIATKVQNVQTNYIKYWLLSHQQTIFDIASGTAQKNVNMESFREISIPIPLPEEQTRIVSIIDRMEETKQHLSAAIDGVKFEIETLGTRTFKFADTPTKRLEELATIKNGDMATKMMSNTGTVPFYSCSAKNPVGTHDVHTFTSENEYILLVRSGGSENNRSGENVGLGNVHLVKGPTAFNVDVCMIVPNDPAVAMYIYCYLRANKPLLGGMAKFTVNLGHINLSQIKELTIPIPPSEIQTQIIQKFTALYKKLADLAAMYDDQCERTAAMFHELIQ